MNDSKRTMTRYLLGELSEAEQTALEEEYFGDPRVFDEVATAESALVDDYVRGRLSPEARQRFEQFYLAHPPRRERMKFAEALATRLDQEGPGVARTEPLRARSRWQALLDALVGRRLAFAVGALLVVSVGLWYVAESRRTARESAQAEAARAEQDRRERELQAARSTRPAEPTAPSAPDARTAPVAPIAPVAPDAPVRSVTLALAVGPGVRASDTASPALLVIPPGTEEVRLQVSLREHDYPSYRVVLRAIGGAEIFRRSDIKPTAAGSLASFTLAVPASRFDAGDYILTLQGATGGEFEDLSQSLFQVRRVR